MMIKGIVVGVSWSQWNEYRHISIGVSRCIKVYIVHSNVRHVTLIHESGVMVLILRCPVSRGMSPNARFFSDIATPSTLAQKSQILYPTTTLQ